MMTNAAVSEFFEKDDILAHMLCPISKKIPFIPGKDRADNTYDFQSAILWIRANPGLPLPGSSVVTTEDQLTFDFAHINTIIKRLTILQPLLENEETRILYLQERIQVIPENERDVQIAALRIIALNGFMSLSESFNNDPSLSFIRRVISKCGNYGRITTNVRCEAYKRVIGPAIQTAVASGIDGLVNILSQASIINFNMLSVKKNKCGDCCRVQ